MPEIGQNLPVSPRKNRPKSKQRSKQEISDEREILASHETIEEDLDGIYRVRKITGSSSTKPYRCPGCDQLIRTATPHIVAWLDGDVESRRHWHTPCWSKRNNRRPNTERTRNAPRY